MTTTQWHNAERDREIGARLKERRLEKGLSLQALAGRASSICVTPTCSLRWHIRRPNSRSRFLSFRLLAMAGLTEGPRVHVV